jgi:low temperature requirement protein LtrA
VTTFLRPLQLRYVAGVNPARKVSWLELFFDLIFVAAVAQVGEPLRDDYSVAGVARFSVLFVLIWWAWIGNSVFATRFDTDDVLQRLLTLLQMFAVAAMAANASDALGSRSSAGFAAAYAVMRLVLVAQYARARQIQSARGLATQYLVGHGAAALLWLVSAFVPVPLRFAIWIVAGVIDLGTPWISVRHSVEVPPDASHLPERFGLFTLILLGESVVAVMHGMKSQEEWTVPAATAAFLGMAMAFAIWWWYFDGTAAVADRHIRSRRDAIDFHVWSYAHLPLYLGIAVAAAGVERIVHDGAARELHSADGLILGTALGAAMAALAVIGHAAPHQHRRRSVRPHLALACATPLFAFAAPLASSVWFVIVFTTLCAAQLGIAMTDSYRGSAIEY